MTVRERQGTGSATVIVGNGSEAGVERPTQFSWEDWFSHASAQQRAEAIGLAQQQGVLYPHQLPPGRNGVKAAIATSPRETEASAALERLVAGQTNSLPPINITPLSFLDPDLDELQRQAVARAVSTPDLFLLQGLPGTGKSRTVAEILRQSASRGKRVLFLASHPASLDVVLHRLAKCPEVLALRFLETAEKADSLPSWLREFTLERQQKVFLERMLLGARGKHGEADSACRQCRDQEPLWAELWACLECCNDVGRRLLALDAQMAALRDTVEHEAGNACGDRPIRARVAALKQAHDHALQVKTATLQMHEAELARRDHELEQCAAKITEREPAYQAKKQNRFWTLAYWANLFNGTVIQEMDSLLTEQTSAQVHRQNVLPLIEHAAHEHRRLGEEFARERAALIDAEVAARQDAFLKERQSLENEERRLGATWDSLCGRLAVAPSAKTPAGLELARQAWVHKKFAYEEQCRFAQEWQKFVEATGPQLASRLPSFANVLTGTFSRWHADAKFRDAAGGTLDLLIVEDADALNDAELLALTRVARRCVLVNDLIEEPASSGRPATTAAPPARAAAGVAGTACLDRLWRSLGGDAGRWPCTWRREGDRLVCQLMPLSPEDRRHLDSEGLADAPDIELCILQRPGARPSLAQVIFAPHGSFADAFRFMVHEVQEFPLQPIGCTAWWSEDAQRHTRHLGANPLRIHTWVEIEPGVRLGTVPNEHGEATCATCLEFDKATGWDRGNAQAWLQRHRAGEDHERGVRLQTSYRYAPPLARFVQAVVRPSDWPPREPAELVKGGKSVEFVAVPHLAKPDWPRKGAGLELDLSASRNGERLPVGLRNGLPARGYVNYQEAQALIRALESWQRDNPAATACRVAVMALYTGQVELLRRLVEQSETLRSRNFPLEIGLPGQMRQRECDVAFVSLTRSHTHRATAFAEDGKQLSLALTRPRSRLFLFGDSGALFKRAHWTGPLEHLDAQAAQQELLCVSRLLAYIQKQKPMPPHANGATNGKG